MRIDSARDTDLFARSIGASAPRRAPPLFVARLGEGHVLRQVRCFRATSGSISGSSVTSAAMKGFWSPTTTTWPTSGFDRIGSSSTAGRDVLAAGRHDDLLLASGDREEALVVETADVAGLEPVAVERRGGRLGIAPVLLEDVDAPAPGSRRRRRGARRRPGRTGPTVPIFDFVARFTVAGAVVSVSP